MTEEHRSPCGNDAVPNNICYPCVLRIQVLFLDRECTYLILKSQIECWEVNIEFHRIPSCRISYPCFLSHVDPHFFPLKFVNYKVLWGGGGKVGEYRKEGRNGLF